eukprot:TRINITY_DN16634_c0_g1_i1.p1 TRINITY_DN16634_c0_g1~~TRINITY_DN16634_c0_g1_i1.p1  ORF type:complete len:190 (+),score=6.06 TRINITY_DN16634_c0_g1_i1:156-725(+)
MKKLLLLFAVLMPILFTSPVLKAEEEEEIPQSMKLYQEKYVLELNVEFEKAWNAVLKSIEEIGCQTTKKSTKNTDDGTIKGIIHSDFCLFVTECDTITDVLKKYSAESAGKFEKKVKPFPFIRGGGWTTGRMQYKFVIVEKGQGKVAIEVKGQLSGHELKVTQEVQFWDSNGILETEMLNRIKKNLGIN